MNELVTTLTGWYTLLSLLSWSAAFALDSPTVVVDRVNGLVADRAVVISDTEFNKLNVLRLCNKYLDLTVDRRLVKLGVFVDREDALRTTFGLGRSHLDYTTWLRYFNLHKRMSQPFAEMVRIGDGAVVRFRERHGGVERIFLSGHDPLEVQISGSMFEIVRVSVQDVVNRHLPVHFFVRGRQGLSPRMATALYNCIKRAIGGTEMSLSLRKDGWFVLESDFPAYDPFETDLRPPDENEYFKRPEVYCGRNAKVNPCSMLRGR